VDPAIGPEHGIHQRFGNQPTTEAAPGSQSLEAAAECDQPK
jgi:hypothetical protein